ncbi:hypothetical protein MO973_43825 [Paenibacillus sp. TRM 82003]|nr:hypothetical protein [Paenibacillus sp. TRM 82003]
MSADFRRAKLLGQPVSVWRDGRLVDRGTIEQYDWDVVTLYSHLDNQHGHFVRHEFTFIIE